MRNILLSLGLLIYTVLSSCSNVNTIYIDIKKQAIVSCDGTGLKKIVISNDSEDVILEGTESIIYFNRVNNISRTSIYDSLVSDYKLVLRPNLSYEVTKDMGYDRAKFHLTFKTDSSGKIVTTSNTNCN